MPPDTTSLADATSMNSRIVSTPDETDARFLPVAEPDLGPLEERLIMEAVRSGWVSSLGEFIGRFEREFATFCGSRHAVTTSNGTTALHLTLVAAGIGPGDEVIVPSLTFVATAAAVRHAGAIPVFVDCEREIGTMNPLAVEAAVTDRTKAVIPVHLFGHPADMDPIIRIAAARNLFVLEDAAESHGATYKGRVTGSLGAAGAFSFYGNKVLTTGEGGMIVSSDPEFVARLRFLRDHAMDSSRRYWHPEVGFNYRLTNPQAALGVAQLSRFAEISEKRRSVLDWYREASQEMALPIVLNPAREWAVPTPWLVCGILPEFTTGSARDRLLAQLRKFNVDTRPYFIPLHLMPPYVGCRTVGADGSDGLPETESLASRGFNLPSSGALSRDDVLRVTRAMAQSLSAS